jgi:hypothetical protein
MKLIGLPVVVLLVLLGGSAAVAAGQGKGCAQPLATVTVPERTYASVNVKEFEGRVYLYAPDIDASGRSFAPFQLWVVEGIYGRPFVQPSGPMDQAAFDKLRRSQNVRATPVALTRSGESARVTISRQPYLLEATVAVSSRGDTVSARLCRP